MNLIDFFTIPVNSITEMTFFFSIIIKKNNCGDDDLSRHVCDMWYVIRLTAGTCQVFW